MKKLLFLLISFLFISCNFNQTYHNREEDKKDAEKITGKFYSLLKKNNREEAFKLIDNKFFETTNKKQLNQMIDDINAECGDKISDTQLKIWETSVSVGTNSKSQYILLYRVERNIQNTQEKFTLEKDDDSIKIVGYDVSLAQ
ncbi:hypothetical protein EG347_08850 [Chryseobacterium sp. G0186]|uniref:hypothetical protein n=1 Tax=Chryseobacterium sp. G0186 TaxID=2487064 RepID=UPI000F4F0D8E|nr:hypothetical protein [Chryseobacterium sp. G0186]AZA77615.1 hypothetical protein EG347_08850 [Chryseobacterium sp. G0186]